VHERMGKEFSYLMYCADKEAEEFLIDQTLALNAAKLSFYIFLHPLKRIWAFI